MSQNDFNIANQGFPQFRTDLNSALQALASTSAGAAAPGTTYAYQLWYDTSTNLLKMRNADNDGFITLAAFDQAADEWELRTAVVQAVDSAGVIIKTDDGTTRVTVADDGSVAFANDVLVSDKIVHTGDTDTAIRFPAADTVTVETAGSERMRISSTGNVGIGTNSAAYKLVVSAAGASGIEFGPAYSGTANLVQHYSRSGAVYVDAVNEAAQHRFNISGTERARINSSGYLLVGTTGIPSNTNAGTMLATPATTANRSATTVTTSTSHWVFYNGNGVVGSISTSGSSTSYNTSSDYRLKENVVPLAGAADRLAQIPVHRFNFIADPDTTVDGFLAHEVQAFVPECVTGQKDQTEIVEIKDEDGNVTGTEERPVYQGIDQSKLVPLLTAALQEALTKIEDLEARIVALEIQ